MTTYLSTFIPGLQKPIEQLLKKNLNTLKTQLLLDGLILYQTDESIETIQKLKFVNNTFLVIKKFEKLPKEKKAFNYMLQQIAKSNIIIEPKSLLSNAKTFRIVTTNENKFVSADQNLLTIIEQKISTLKDAKLKVTSHRPQIEFWFLRRRENIGFFMLKLTKNATNNKLSAGELRPELAYILCFLSAPNKNDIFLDPFAGYGAIAITRAKSFPYDLIFASDNSKDFKQAFKNKLKTKRIKKTIISKVQNALNMQAFQDGFITKIVTDPPWGLYKNIKDITSFYSLMMDEFVRILKTKGIIVILTARKNEFEKVISKYPNLSLTEKYDILVSGKKAAIYKIQKI